MPSVRVLIADDQCVTRSGLSAMAKNSPSLNFIGEAYDAESVARAAAELAPDVVLLNLRALCGLTLRDLVREFDGSVSVIVLCSRDSQLGFVEACQAGVAGIAELDAVEGDLEIIVSLVHRGRSVCLMARNTFTMAMLDDRSSVAGEPRSLLALTPRESEVLRLMAGGLGNKQIAAGLHVSETTVKKHVTSVMRKMGVSSRVEAALQFSRGSAACP